MKTKTIFSILVLAINVVLLSASGHSTKKHFTIYPAPSEELLSEDFKVFVEGENLPVYSVKVAPEDQELRWKAMDDKENLGKYYDEAAFAYFDMNDEVDIKVTNDEEIRSVKILPSSAGIVANVKGKTVSFKINSPMNVTVEINGNWVSALHLFANPIEENVPDKNDPNVIYFGPGIHYVSNLMVGDNKTVYIAGGAIVRGIAQEKAEAVFDLRGKNISFRGRGIIDGGLCPSYSRVMIAVAGSDIELNGVIIRDPSHWTIPVRWSSDRVHIDNLKIMGYRANSDGIDILNSRNVLIENCFIRTLDDLVVIKTFKNEGKAENIIVKNCVLWNEVAHALSIGAEIREDVDNVIFENCDIIHDKGREWTLRVFLTDAGRVSNVIFKDIRIEESQRFISLFINKSIWTQDEERGHIKGVYFNNISALGKELRIELQGFDQEHLVEDVFFRDVTFNNQKISTTDVVTNDYVKNINFEDTLRNLTK
jgi:hypothetical protein